MNPLVRLPSGEWGFSGQLGCPSPGEEVVLGPALPPVKPLRAPRERSVFGLSQVKLRELANRDPFDWVSTKAFDKGEDIAAQLNADPGALLLSVGSKKDGGLLVQRLEVTAARLLLILVGRRRKRRAH